jgi:hypothetical protein
MRHTARRTTGDLGVPLRVLWLMRFGVSSGGDALPGVEKNP